MSLYMATLEAQDGSLLEEPIFDYSRDNLKKAVAEEWENKTGELCIWYCDLKESYRDIKEAKQNWNERNAP